MRFFAPLVGMLVFIIGGGGGIINASYQLNQIVHNTWWVTGHFHMTLATSVVLTYFAALYWLIPVVRNRVLTPAVNRLGIVQTVVWALGMLLMSGTMHIVGLMGAPRRSAYFTYNDHQTALSWLPYYDVISVGGILLFVSVLLAVFNFIYLWFFAPQTDKTAEFPIGVINEKAAAPPPILERWSVWIGISIALSVIAYAVPMYHMIVHPSPGSLPIRPW